MEAVDLLINPTWIAPVIPRQTVFNNCSIAVNRGKIIAILPRAEALKKYRAVQQIDLPDHMVIPGLINSHCHAAMSLFRGMADDLPLESWLNDHIWPAEAKWVNGDFVRDGTELAIAEMIRSGTTCFSDMYFFPNQTAECAVAAGIRAQVAFPVLDFPSAWARNADEYIHKGLQLRDDYKASDSINIAFGPHSVYTVSEEPLRKIGMLSEELDTCIQIHLHETAQEVSACLTKTGKRPLELIKDAGLLSPLTQCVHMTQLSDDDLTILAESNAHIIHCPQSNLKLASGILPHQAAAQHNINIALGTDGAASNNALNLFSELKTAALLAKASASNAAALGAFEALEMATLNGAKAMGLDEEIGSLEKGKSADITAINLGEIEFQPLYNPVSQLAYTDVASRVSHVWCKGEPLLLNRELQTLSSPDIIAKARQWQQKIAPSTHI